MNIETIRLYVLGGALALAAGAFVIAVLATSWERIKDSPRRWIFIAGAIGCTLYAGTKGKISYPYTDSEQRYLTDNGSYVSNDTVRVAFTRIIAPASATMRIDRRRLDQTNDVDWVNFTNTTFAAFNQPQILQVPAATNWNWIVYTTWTPGPTVQTNGVWHAYWGKDGKADAYFIPVRTCVRVDSEVIATPKSKWSATNNTEEVEQ